MLLRVSEMPLPLAFCWVVFHSLGFPGGISGKEPASCAGDVKGASLSSGLGRSPGGGHGNPLQYSCLENPKDNGAWWAMVHWVTNSWTQLKQLSTHAHSILWGFLGDSVEKESACQWRRHRFDPCIGKILWTRKWQPTVVFLPGKFHGQRSLVG